MEKKRKENYWFNLVGYCGKWVENASTMLEGVTNWGNDHPMITFSFNWDVQNMEALIKSSSNGSATIRFSLGFLDWLDDAAAWMTESPAVMKNLYINSRGDHDYKEWMMSQWLLWVVYHEVAHYLCGHIRFIRAKKWTEFGEENASTNTRILEYDADINASVWFFQFMSRINDAHVKLYDSDDIAFAYWDLGIIFSAIFVAWDFERPETGYRTHPEPKSRLATFASFGGAILGSQSDGARKLDALLKGLKKGIELMPDEGRDDFVMRDIGSLVPIEEIHAELIKLGVNKLRLAKWPNDWLNKKCESIT